MLGLRVPVTGGELRVDDHDNAAPDAPPVVLIHGFSFDRSSWAPQVAPFAAHARTLLYDLRGFGESGRPVATRSHLDDLIELLDHLDVAQAQLVGLSLGANVALAALVERPERVAGAVLASPGLPGYVWTTPRPPDEAAEHARRFGIDAARRFWLDHPLFASADDHPEVRAELERIVAGFDGWPWSDGEQSAPLTAVRDRLGEITTPTLVLHGGRDLPGYREIARILAAEIPGAQRCELPAAGHLVNLEAPAEFTARVLEFVGSTRRCVAQ